MKRIVVTPHRITGRCNVHRMGDQIVFIKGKDRMLCIDLERSTCKRVCMHALSMLFPYVFAEKTWKSDLGPDYYHCPDPGPECKGKGSVIFQVERQEGKEQE
jgi:uncharacterized repeat protein (TIGR04076 family)